MCTVTYIPYVGGCFLTSSRDEQASRPTLPPRKYVAAKTNITYPKDEAAGGTWIASAESGRTVCLLNGAFTRHVRAEPYDRSRGKVLLESFEYDTAADFCKKVNLENVEPFTLLLLDSVDGLVSGFYEFRWDGSKKYFKELSTNEMQIWSSATLYDESVRRARARLFEDWVRENKEYNDRRIFDFHNTRHGLSTENDIVMHGAGDLMTLSISQIHATKEQTTFHYSDLVNNKQYQEVILKND